ncbi:hypothetical protein IAT40_000105 [Kwoniella sp. CBS 6097]
MSDAPSNANVNVPGPSSSESAPAPAPAASTSTTTTTESSATITADSEISAGKPELQAQGSSSSQAEAMPNGGPVNVNVDVNAEAGPSSPAKVASPTAPVNDNTNNTAAEVDGGDIEMADGENPSPSAAQPDAADTGTEINGDAGNPNEGDKAGHVNASASGSGGAGGSGEKEDGAPRDAEGEDEEPGLNLSELFAAKRDEETARRDRSLAEFLVMLDGYKPLIPEEITEYYLQRAGFECSDPRLKRLLSLSAQKFVSDLSRDAYHFAKLRTNGQAAGRGRPAAGVDRNRVVLTMDDLSLALGDHGVNVKKPDYCESESESESSLS